MSRIVEYLKTAVNMNASDVFIVAGAKPSVKVEAKIKALEESILTQDMTKEMVCEIFKLAKRSSDKYLSVGDDDFSFAIAGLARFRVNTYRQRGSMAAIVRIVSFDIPNYKDCGIPQEILDLSKLDSGMIIVTGTAGSGKSTTQAIITNEINENKACHIVTLEDPIEYLHKDKKSIISQREVAIDTADFLTGLRACLRQSLDVILLGEMRDGETIKMAMTAAETGHMIMTTLHTKGAVKAIDRIVDAFSGELQQQARVQLSMVLRTVVSQQLVPDINGGLVPVFEIMHNNSAIKNLIREGKSHQIDNMISTGNSEGMMSMDQSLFELWQEGRISKETAMSYCDNVTLMQRRMKN